MTRPRRVLLLVQHLALTRDHRLRKQATALLNAGFAVTVVCRSDPDNHKFPGVTLREFPAPRDAQNKIGYLREYAWTLFMAGWQILCSLLTEGFDAIQVRSTPDIYFIFTLPLRALGKAVVFDARDLSPELYARRYGAKNGPVFGLLRALEWVSFRSATSVLVVNRSVEVVATKRCRVPAGRVTQVGNGPVMSNLRPPLRYDRHPANGGHTCCFIGVMGPQDGVELALRAAAVLVHERHRDDTRFVFAGTGDTLPALKDLAASLRLENWVSFPGWMPADKIAALLHKADVGLEPNPEDFVSPVKVMEYMAYGLPVVAFDLFETRQILRTGGRYAPAGNVVAFADCIEALLDDPKAREELGAAGHERALNVLAWEHQAPRYVQVYENLLAGPYGDQPRAGAELERAVP